MIFEKWGAYGNSERRTQMWRQQVPPPGDARSDVWQVMEFAKRFTLKDVWGEQSDSRPEAAGFEDGQAPRRAREGKGDGLLGGHEPLRRAFRHRGEPGLCLARSRGRRPRQPHGAARGDLDWFPEKALFEEYAAFGRGHVHDLAPFDLYFAKDVRGLRWPVIDGKETRWRFNEEHDPYAKEGDGLPLLRRRPSRRSPREISTG